MSRCRKNPLNRDGSGTLAYNTIIAGGFKDAGAVTHRHKVAGGLTWGHDEFLADPTPTFDRRIDFVFYEGALFSPEQATVEDLWLNRSVLPLWASDHASLSAEFQLQKGPSEKGRDNESGEDHHGH